MIKRILVPVDFSDTALQALDYAIEFGKPFRPELVVLFVVEPVYYATPADLYGPAANLSMLLDEQRRIGKEQLLRLAAELEKRGVNARTVLQTGTPFQVIVDTAERLKADLIVMATHGRTGLSHVLLGSVAERVVRSAACPVVTVRGYKPAKRKPRTKRPSR
ncbi:MAG: universal stress protein [Deltaproteobacteria bacterium]|nr:universal stress protein [Deltaproteobacteria bacterium]